jgi:hypothetical protein
MQQAQQKLEEAEREGAIEEQQQALDALEQAKAELEKILRQLREEEIERMLVMLEARFRQMLEAQLEVYEGTLRLAKVPAESRDQDDEIEAGRLSRKESAIVLEADKALNLLRADGSSVAFPEAVEQMRGDMQQVADRLRQVDVGELTQGIEQDIIRSLEEMLDALEKAIAEMENNRQQPSQQQQAGEPVDPALVDKLAELRLIRSLQMRVNNRTDLYAKLIEEEPSRRAGVLEQLDELANRQQRIYKATHDLHLGKNQ